MHIKFSSTKSYLTRAGHKPHVNDKGSLFSPSSSAAALSWTHNNKKEISSSGYRVTDIHAFNITGVSLVVGKQL